MIVVVEFTGELRKRKHLTVAARLARTPAAAMAGEEDLSGHATSTLDFDASRAEFEELARSAGATIAATLVQRRQGPDPSDPNAHLAYSVVLLRMKRLPDAEKEAEAAVKVDPKSPQANNLLGLILALKGNKR